MESWYQRCNAFLGEVFMKKIFLVLALLLSVFVLSAEEVIYEVTYKVGSNISITDSEKIIYDYRYQTNYKVLAILPYEKGYIIKMKSLEKDEDIIFEFYVTIGSTFYASVPHNAKSYKLATITNIQPNSFTLEFKGEK